MASFEGNCKLNSGNWPLFLESACGARNADSGRRGKVVSTFFGHRGPRKLATGWNTYLVSRYYLDSYGLIGPTSDASRGLRLSI